MAYHPLLGSEQTTGRRCWGTDPRRPAGASAASSAAVAASPRPKPTPEPAVTATAASLAAAVSIAAASFGVATTDKVAAGSMLQTWKAASESTPGAPLLERGAARVAKAACSTNFGLWACWLLAELFLDLISAAVYSANEGWPFEQAIWIDSRTPYIWPAS